MPEISPDADISGLATHPHDDSTAYVLFSVSWLGCKRSKEGRAKILRTTDLGQTWSDLSGFYGTTNATSMNGFPDVAVYDLLVMPDNPSTLWVGTEIGLFISDDDGASWYYSNNGLPAAAIWRMRIIDDQVMVITHGRGIWTVDLKETVESTDATEELPTAFTLSQNYPNPFHSETTIRFGLPTSSHVSLAVFDVAGRKVATLADQLYGAGEHTLTWDAAGHASGVYFYRMATEGDVVQTQSMMLIR